MTARPWRFGPRAGVGIGLFIGPCVGVCLVTAGPLAAQAPDRIWGQVHTTTGAIHQGFIRWDRNEAAWADRLDGDKLGDPDVLDRIAEGLGEDLTARGRSVEFLGVRISWDDDEAPGAGGSGIRFGHLRSLRVSGPDAAVLTLKSGEEVELRGGSSDLGEALRGLVVEAPLAESRDPVDLSWAELDRIEFGPAPPGARAREERLYGVVEDRWGGQWTGYVAWDRDEALSGDVLDGSLDGSPQKIAFGSIAAIERVGSGGGELSLDKGFQRLPTGGSRVTLVDGEVRVLSGSNAVGDGHRGVQVSDPALGQIDVPWDAFVRVRLSTPPGTAGYDTFDGGARLRGSVSTDDGELLVGRIRWNADEAWSWESLEGSRRGIDYAVEFGHIASIERRSSRGATVTLRDGRTLILEESADVDRHNAGIVVELDDGTLRVVPWARFERAVFEGN